MNTMTMMTESNLKHALHLSADELDDHLLGTLSAEATTHLAECADCAARVARNTEPMASFRDVTMAWSERRSATMPLPAVNAQGFVWQRRMGWTMATFALGVGLAFTGAGHRVAMLNASMQSSQAAEPAISAPVQMAAAAPVAVAVEVPVPAEQLASDNHMLQAIDAEVNAAAESPAALGLESVTDKHPLEAGQPTLEN